MVMRRLHLLALFTVSLIFSLFNQVDSLFELHFILDRILVMLNISPVLFIRQLLLLHFQHILDSWRNLQTIEGLLATNKVFEAGFIDYEMI